MSNISKIPNEPHYAILVEKVREIYYEADERSKLFPGHGYPAHTETVRSFNYEFFLDRKLWEDRIAKLSHEKQAFRAIQANPATIKTETVVSVNFP